MLDFLKVSVFALALATFVILLAVALWNEGRSKIAVPRPVQYTGRQETPISDVKTGFPRLGPDDRILVVPAQ